MGEAAVSSCCCLCQPPHDGGGGATPVEADRWLSRAAELGVSLGEAGSSSAAASLSLASAAASILPKTLSATGTKASSGSAFDGDDGETDPTSSLEGGEEAT